MMNRDGELLLREISCTGACVAGLFENQPRCSFIGILGDEQCFAINYIARSV